MVKLVDVARACGLSVSQTSRALNGRQDVSEETKRRVSQTAAAMGYVKNLTAQTLSAKTPMQLAVVVTGVSEQTENSSFFFGIMQGVNSFANQNGYETVVYMMEKSPECFETYCRQRGAGGMILMNADYDEPAVKKVAEGNFPCVFIDIPYTGERKGCVIVNNAYYSRLAVEHMVKRGRKRIAMITGSGHSIVEKEREEVVEERRRDYKTVLQERIQRQAGQELTYCMVREEGPDHAKTFVTEVQLNGAAIGEGSGHSKKESEQMAAKSALEKLDNQ